MSTEIQRYHMDSDPDTRSTFMAGHPNGGWVRYSDLAAVQAQLAEVKAAHELDCQLRDQYEMEATALRSLFPEILEHLKSGGCAPTCSIEFLSEIPGEVGSVVAKLRADLAAANAALAKKDQEITQLKMKS